MIPGCTKCEAVSYDTGLPLYGTATFVQESSYLSCFECQFARYVEEGRGDEPVKCSHCSQKWEGCSSCGLDGQICERCY
jgi:hypothetical protein